MCGDQSGEFVCVKGAMSLFSLQLYPGSTIRQVHMYMYGLGLARVKMDYRALTIRFQVAGVTATSRRGIKQLGISFGSIFPLFSYDSSRGQSGGGPSLLMTALGCI